MEIKYTDIDSALKAVNKSIFELKYCSNEVLANINFLKKIVELNYYALRELRKVQMPDNSGLIINNKKLMLELVKINPIVFRDLGSDLKNDEEIVTYCVSKNGALLKEAGKDLQKNKELILLGLNNNIYTLDCVNDETLKNDKDIALKILDFKHNRYNIKWFGNSLKQELIDGIGYDITIEPLNQIVIDHVKEYLKCKIEGKEYIKPKNPFQKEERKIEVKQEVQPETKNEEKLIEQPKVIETKPVEQPKEEINKIVEDNINETESYINNEIEHYKVVNQKINDLQRQIDKSKEIIKLEQEKIMLYESKLNDIRVELNTCVNNTKTMILGLKK